MATLCERPATGVFSLFSIFLPVKKRTRLLVTVLASRNSRYTPAWITPTMFRDPSEPQAGMGDIDELLHDSLSSQCWYCGSR